MATKDDTTFFKLSQEAMESAKAAEQPQKKTLTIISRLVLFFMFPLSVGSFGLGAAHINSIYGKDPKPLNFERDFILPFLITLVLVVIVTIQTGSFSKYKADPLVSWPKVVKKKKIIHKRVVVDDDGNVIEDEDLLKKIGQSQTSKKND